MTVNSEKPKLIRILPSAAVWVAGLVLILVCAPRTTNINRGVGAGLVLLCIGSLLVCISIWKEYFRVGKKFSTILGDLLPDYPVIQDNDETTGMLSGFKTALDAYLKADRAEGNSRLQTFSTQLLWYSFALQKKRLERLGVKLEMKTFRRGYSAKPVREDKYFDGRYNVRDISEEISSERRFIKNGRIIRSITDNEIAHYAVLSAKQSGENGIICPSCGHESDRSNLIDGCDYCGTKFTVEDLKNRVGSFGFRHDFATAQSKKDAVRDLIYPWARLLYLMFFVYFGFIGAFVYTDFGFFGRLLTGLFAAALLTLAAWAVGKLLIGVLIIPAVLIGSATDIFSSKSVSRPPEEINQEKYIAGQVRRSDPNFSLQSFFGGVQNKLAAIHYADIPTEVNAFSEAELSGFLGKYAAIADFGIDRLTMDSYRNDRGWQIADVTAELTLNELTAGRIKTKKESVKMRLVKSAYCKTQAVCAPSALKCAGCGAPISLMEGKHCEYCGRDLDLKQYDWVIVDYRSSI